MTATENQPAKLSAEEKKLIAPFVSDLESQVFTLTGLPEEVVAVLFAYYSRSREDLRTNLAKLLADQTLGIGASGEQKSALVLAEQKAREFHEKWVVGYGHSSVAEHAVIHLALERISIVASKVVEDTRLASYTEKSTRYVVFDQDSFLPLDEDLPAALAKRYREGATSLLDAYLRLQPRVTELLMQLHPRKEKQAERAYQAMLRAQACDVLRYLLPAGTRTHVGMTLNARALEHQLQTMFASNLGEIRRLAALMHAQAAAVVPTLVKYVEPTAHRTGLTKRLAPAFASLQDSLRCAKSEQALSQTAGGEVRLLRCDADALERVVSAIVFEHGQQNLTNTHAGLKALSREAQSQIFAAYVAERGKFDAPLRALEQTHYLFEVELDEGAYRDLQRHRMQTQNRQLLGMDLGYELPPLAESLGIAGDMRRVIENVYPIWAELSAHSPEHAQYVVPLAARRRYTITCNLREVFQLIELRSAKQGHWSYRTIAQKMWQALKTEQPWAAEHVRVDLADYSLARA